MDEEIQELMEGAKDLGIELTSHQQKQFQDYSDIIEQWNSRINLVRVKSRDELMRVHMLDSLWCCKAFNPGWGTKLMDLGSGAGFPGIPLKICFPETNIYLLESQRKRGMFLQEVIRTLKLDNCFILTGRAEELARETQFRDSFTCVVARAVAPMITLVELALPFITIAGQLVALKGYAAEAELNEATFALEQLGGAVDRVIPYRFTEERGRYVVSIQKIQATPEKFPRRPGMPAKKPLMSRNENTNGRRITEQ
jgi:16S rRNA (guanine527-N7)-methyltransferase